LSFWLFHWLTAADSTFGIFKKKGGVTLFSLTYIQYQIFLLEVIIVVIVWLLDYNYLCNQSLSPLKLWVWHIDHSRFWLSCLGTLAFKLFGFPFFPMRVPDEEYSRDSWLFILSVLKAENKQRETRTITTWSSTVPGETLMKCKFQ
jgi:hypothetical protein